VVVNVDRRPEDVEIGHIYGPAGLNNQLEVARAKVLRMKVGLTAKLDGMERTS
jgi:hypothetical protein